ncbi:MAG: hypothetical protein GY749_38285 [Desulfobacteraceae bacterium]|nr:hypothetical protein [Desulfobacteraceae bacterium]
MREADDFEFAAGYFENDNRLLSDTEPIPLCCEKNCLSLLTPVEIAERQSSVKQMTKREQDICILSHLVSGRISENKGNVGEGRVRFVYRFDNGRTLCRKAFLFIYGIKSGNRLKRLQKLAASNILLPFVHGNTGNVPIHALQKDDVDKIIQFVMNYAEIHGLPDPGRLRRNTRDILLSVFRQLHFRMGGLQNRHAGDWKSDENRKL